MTAKDWYVVINGPSDFHLVVKHTCGHEMRYGYAIKSIADKEGPERSRTICGRCYSNSLIKDNPK